jgi:hypothetical protein
MGDSHSQRARCARFNQKRLFAGNHATLWGGRNRQMILTILLAQAESTYRVSGFPGSIGKRIEALSTIFVNDGSE